ncbi:MAG: hypothetical protein GXO69_03575 [Acidobacteria bacterium]|nr:hypothetical protein [Acidobacteriota bacterium]
MTIRTRRIIVWTVAAVFFYIPVAWFTGSMSDGSPFVSPYISYEVAARDFAAGVGAHPSVVRAVSLSSTIAFKEVNNGNEPGRHWELEYVSPIYFERVSLNFLILRKYWIFHNRDPFEILLFRNKNKVDYPIDYWCEPFKTIFGDTVFSVSYRFKSGIVLQVVNADEIVYGMAQYQQKENCKVARIYFVGEKFRSDFPLARILNESDVKKLKKQNNCK